MRISIPPRNCFRRTEYMGARLTELAGSVRRGRYDEGHVWMR
jgi:hypothetical protein